ncbi:unnamed protein product, partial [Sphagnum troendelagicum]
MMLQKKYGLATCSGRQLCLLVGLQVVVFVFLVGPLLWSDQFYIWFYKTHKSPGNDESRSHHSADPRNHGAPEVEELLNSRNTTSGFIDLEKLKERGIVLPAQNKLSKKLMEQNLLPPRNQGLYPKLKDDHVKVVLYVHNRPEYLRVVIAGLSEVEGIEETLLIVSHDGFFEEMDSIVQGIHFCQVKQIYAPWSPHIFPNSFPGVTPGDCEEKVDAVKLGCSGNPDQYGNYRAVRIVSLKHHWWWMMNTVWDGLAETKDFDGHIMFIEEDHYLLPNAYRTIQYLTKIKGEKCPYCVAANVAPLDVKSRGEQFNHMVAEKVGNVGYTFNRTVWQRIHDQATPFCTFDEYNWDITMWATIYPTFGGAMFTLRGPRTSAIHFGKCGLHAGYQKGSGLAGCKDNELHPQAVNDLDKVLNIHPDWHVIKYEIRGYNLGFKGWGGWGDKRDHQLCLQFSSMYHNRPPLEE